MAQFSRRDCLKAGLLASAGAALEGCGFVARKIEEPRFLSPADATADEQRLLDRVGFGPDPTSLGTLRKLGVGDFVARQLGAAFPEPPGLLLQLQTLDVLQLETSDLMDLPAPAVLGQLQQAALLYAVYSPNQLRERMVDFWTNHFNIFGRKGNVVFSKGPEEVRIIRKHALGSFPEMLNAIARSPAMLEYLDNQKNQKGVPNENYARELMELHTLGLHGGYTQKDVQEVARCFTGWTIENRFLHARGSFRFDGERHDDGEKHVLGHRIAPGGGEEDGKQVLAILAKHPSTAHFLAGKLTRYFVGEPAEPALQAAVASAYLQSGGDVAATITPLLVHVADATPILKRPFDFAVSAIRHSGGDTDGGAPIRSHLEKMGEALYEWPMPDGYPEKTSAWTSSLLPRWNFAFALAQGKIPGSTVPGGDNEALALHLCSPEFQWR